MKPGLHCRELGARRLSDFFQRHFFVFSQNHGLPLQREAVVLAEYEEMSLEEIAQATGADLAAVKSRLHRARQNLRRMLAPWLQLKGPETKGVLHGTK